MAQVGLESTMWLRRALTLCFFLPTCMVGVGHRAQSFAVLWITPRTVCLLSKHSTNQATSTALV